MVFARDELLVSNIDRSRIRTLMFLTQAQKYSHACRLLEKRLLIDQGLYLAHPMLPNQIFEHKPICDDIQHSETSLAGSGMTAHFYAPVYRQEMRVTRSKAPEKRQVHTGEQEEIQEHL